MGAIKGDYAKTENFEIVDTIGVPHPYCISPRHLAYASKYYGHILTEDGMRAAEKSGNAKCGVRGCTLSFDEHEHALLVACKQDIKDEAYKEELHQMLLANKEEAEKNGYAGFAFLDKRGG